MMRTQAVKLAITVLPVRGSRDYMTYSDPISCGGSHGNVFLRRAWMAMFVARVHGAVSQIHV